MKTKNKIIVFLSIFFLIIASIIIGRAFINSKIDDAIKKARNRPIEVVSYTVKESDFYQSIETFGTAIANKSFSIRIKKENIIKSIDFNKQQIIKKGTIIASLRDRNIIAPFEGRLGKREITPGILGNNNSIIATLDDSTKLKVDVKLPENYVGILKNGLKVQATSDAFNKIFYGKIDSVSSRVDPSTRSVLASITVDNKNLELVPGMLLDIQIIYNETQEIGVPENSLLIQGDTAFAYKVLEDNTIEKIEVKIGKRNYGKVSILDGLSVGDKIVKEGISKVRDKIKIKIIN